LKAYFSGAELAASKLKAGQVSRKAKSPVPRAQERSPSQLASEHQEGVPDSQQMTEINKSVKVPLGTVTSAAHGRVQAQPDDDRVNAEQPSP
jgi:hypothetical protein